MAGPSAQLLGITLSYQNGRALHALSGPAAERRGTSSPSRGMSPTLLARFQSAPVATRGGLGADGGRPLWATIEYLANSPTHRPSAASSPLAEEGLTWWLSVQYNRDN